MVVFVKTSSLLFCLADSIGFGHTVDELILSIFMKQFHECFVRCFSDDDETDTVDGSTSQKIRQKKENNSSVAAKSATPPSFKESRFFHGNR